MQCFHERRSISETAFGFTTFIGDPVSSALIWSPARDPSGVVFLVRMIFDRCWHFSAEPITAGNVRTENFGAIRIRN
jgi:hypothetical protein